MASFIIGDYRYTILENNTVRAQVVNKTKTTYQDIPSQVTYDNVRYSVTSMYYCFDGCTSLITAPIIPNGVKDMMACFNNCTSLTTPPPEIPNSVTDMRYCFAGCTSLITAPIMSNGFTDMISCFNNCTSLTIAPVIPNSVTNMNYCFRNCTSLTTPPVIPNGVNSMSYCFYGCTSLTIAPVIPNSVTSMYGCLRDCTNLEGDVYVYTKNTQYDNAFLNTDKPIIIHAMNNNIDTCQGLAMTANNNNVYVNVHPEEEITFVDTEMKYKNGDKTETLSLQTNANLVQCEIPDLVNGDYITTNVNDALIDLYKRGVLD